MTRTCDAIEGNNERVPKGPTWTARTGKESGTGNDRISVSRSEAVERRKTERMSTTPINGNIAQSAVRRREKRIGFEVCDGRTSVVKHVVYVRWSFHVTRLAKAFSV